MITAEEYILKNMDGYSDGWETRYSFEETSHALREFVALHIKQALEKAYENADLELYNSQDQICFMTNDMGESYVLSKSSILNAYNIEENIK